MRLHLRPGDEEAEGTVERRLVEEVTVGAMPGAAVEVGPQALDAGDDVEQLCRQGNDPRGRRGSPR